MMENSLAVHGGGQMQGQIAVAYTDPAAVAAAEGAKARIQAAYIMAIQRPRSYDNSRVRILNACMRTSFAELVEYQKPVGKSTIKGASIRFAELALREWGNITSEIQVVYDDELVRRISVIVTDLETNTMFSSSIQINKTIERKDKKGREVITERLNSYDETVYIVKATEDEVLNKQASAVSKSMRNEGLRLIPQEIVEEAIETARETLRSRDKKDPDAGRKKLADAFASLNIMPSQLEKYIGHPLAQCSPAELTSLRGIFAAIRDGESKWSDYLDAQDKTEDSPKPASKSDRLAGAIGKKNPAAPTNPPELPVIDVEPIPIPESPAQPEIAPVEPEEFLSDDPREQPTDDGTFPFDTQPTDPDHEAARAELVSLLKGRGYFDEKARKALFKRVLNDPDAKTITMSTKEISRVIDAIYAETA